MTILIDARHPETCKWRTAEVLRDYYGKGKYGLRFSDGQVFHWEDCKKGIKPIEAKK